MKAVVLLLVALSVPSLAGEYVVGLGDTLWDLSMHFYGTPLLWEEILAANPHVHGPRYLYPGMVLVIPGVSGRVMSTGSGSYAVTHATAAVLNRSSEPLLSRLQRESAGMVAFDPVNPLGRVVQVNTEEVQGFRFSTALPGDMLEIDYGSRAGALPGQVFHIYRSGEEVTDPLTGALGRVYRVAGVCSVHETTSETSIAKVEHGYLAIREGDLILPYSVADEVRINNSPVTATAAVWVLALKNPDVRNAYSYDVVYINAGSESRLSPGDVFSAYTEGEQVETADGRIIVTADIPVADLVVLTTERRSAAVMVVSNRSARLVAPGDKLFLVRSQAVPIR